MRRKIQMKRRARNGRVFCSLNTDKCLQVYQVAFSQPRSSMALTTREMATMYAASRM